MPRPAYADRSTRLSIALLGLAVLAPLVGEAALRLLAVPALLPLWRQVLMRSLLAAAIWIPLTLILWSSAAVVRRVRPQSVRFAVIIALAMLATVAEAIWSRWVYDAAARDPLDWWLARGMPGLFTALTIVVARSAREQLIGVRAASSRLHRSQMALRTAELHRLDRQLQPHFLYNTLNTIAEMVHRDPQVAERLVSTVRHLFDRMGVREVDERSIRDEIDALQPYLELQQARFDQRLTVTIDLPRALEHCVVPTLILQPLVENAIRHGVERSMHGGRIAIAVTEYAGHLDVCVRNDVPLDGAGPTVRPEGIGLRNARERLACLYGNAAWLAFELGPDGNALARVRLPTRRAMRALPSEHSLADDALRASPTFTNPVALYRRVASPWRAIALSVVAWTALLVVSVAWSAFVAWQTHRSLRDVIGPPRDTLQELVLYVILTAIAILSAAAPWSPRVSSQRVLGAQLLAAAVGVVVVAQLIAFSPESRIAKLSAVNTLVTRASVLSAILVAVTGWRWYVDQLGVLIRTDALERTRLQTAQSVSSGVDPQQLSKKLAQIAQLARIDPMSADASVVELADTLRATLAPARVPRAQHV